MKEVTYSLLHMNGVREEAEILDMLLDNEHGVSLSRLMSRCNYNPNQVRNTISGIDYTYLNDSMKYYKVERLRKRRVTSDYYRGRDDIGYEGFLRVNYSTEIYRLTTEEG